MRTKIYPFVIAILIFTFTSCKKNSPVPIKTKTDTTKIDTSKTDTSKKDTFVYIAGYTADIHGNSRATYWKSGVSVSLGPGAASAIAINNGDIYVAGYYNASNGANIAAYWKNGVITKLADSSNSSQAFSIFVQGKDIYAAGVMNVNGPTHTAVYWKNGVAYPLSDLNVATSIIVNNGNVYVAGAGGYSKNGVFVKLTNYSTAYGIAIDGDDIYVGGNTDVQYQKDPNTPVSYPFIASYWQNGTPFFLDDTSKQSTVNACAIHDHIPLFVGYTSTSSNRTSREVATYWKNGVKTLLADTLSDSNAVSIAINGNDVYILGSYNSKTIYWKNGVSYKLPQVGSATSIALSTHN